MGKVKKIVQTSYIDQEEGFNYKYKPIEDSLIIKKTESGYKVGYLVQDDSYRSPDEDGDDNLFLVHYHRGFDVCRDKIITEDDARNWYRGEFDDYEDENGNIPKDIPQAEKYWIFPVSALIHSGVWLSVGTGTHSCDPGGWDTSHVGLVLAAKSEWPNKSKALWAAKAHVYYWNQYLSGDVYGKIIHKYDENKEFVESIDECWGYYGYDETMQELKSQMEG
jgi:hypothetical protein